MNIFNVIGPVMIGPSSSHTAGVVRIGKVAKVLLRDEIKKATIFFSGSFSTTYEGHGSDKAVAGGLLGYDTDDSRIRDSIKTFRNSGKELVFLTENLGDYHPNTLRIHLIGENGKELDLVGCSVGGGEISIRRLNSYEIELSATKDTLIIPHNDISGIIAKVAFAIALQNKNIGNMKVFRNQRGGQAMMIIELDQYLETKLIDEINKISDVIEVTYLEPIK